GAFAAALCWMLLGWTTRPWAIAVTSAAIAGIGVSSYWAQSYWGGMVAACGGALLFGSLRRLSQEPRVGTAGLMGFGVIVLAMARPFEGALAVAASMVMR